MNHKFSRENHAIQQSFIKERNPSVQINHNKTNFISTKENASNLSTSFNHKKMFPRSEKNTQTNSPFPLHDKRIPSKSTSRSLSKSALSNTFVEKKNARKHSTITQTSQAEKVKCCTIRAKIEDLYRQCQKDSFRPNWRAAFQEFLEKEKSIEGISQNDNPNNIIPRSLNIHGSYLMKLEKFWILFIENMKESLTLGKLISICNNALVNVSDSGGVSIKKYFNQCITKWKISKKEINDFCKLNNLLINDNKVLGYDYLLDKKAMLSNLSNVEEDHKKVKTVSNIISLPDCSNNQILLLPSNQIIDNAENTHYVLNSIIQPLQISNDSYEPNAIQRISQGQAQIENCDDQKSNQNSQLFLIQTPEIFSKEKMNSSNQKDNTIQNSVVNPEIKEDTAIVTKIFDSEAIIEDIKHMKYVLNSHLSEQPISQEKSTFQLSPPQETITFHQQSSISPQNNHNADNEEKEIVPKVKVNLEDSYVKHLRELAEKRGDDPKAIDSFYNEHQISENPVGFLLDKHIDQEEKEKKLTVSSPNIEEIMSSPHGESRRKSRRKKKSIARSKSISRSKSRKKKRNQKRK